MAIPTPPDLSDIIFEFGSIDRPNGLREAYDRIFGNPSGGWQSDFGGYGKPVLSNLSTSVVDGNTIVVDYDIDVNNTFGRVELQYSEDQSFSSGVTTTLPQTNNSNGSYSINTGSLDYNTQYYLRLRAWNDFNPNDGDKMVEPNPPNTLDVTTGSQPQLSPPGILNVNLIPNGSRYNLEIEFSYDDSTNSFTAEAEFDPVGRFSLNLVNSENWGTNTNPKIFEGESSNLLLQGGEEITVYLRADAFGGSQQSAFDSYTFTANP